ncbi:CLUMA_CG021178, isoform A [Clunio marinus]|uniref:CLUMA_CG021178, isoform A n=1 Tax=Clunio marinus TaxID=568069 RepID=A0A1J1J691_9DIPT|nr:CLUMA_CG021178, isoform A [Clunio marinus]
MRSQVQKVCLSVSSDGGKMIYGLIHIDPLHACDIFMRFLSRTNNNVYLQMHIKSQTRRINLRENLLLILN